MADKVIKAESKEAEAGLSELQAENQRLIEENKKLVRQARSVAEVNAYSAELLVELEEANKRLQAEIENHKGVEQKLRQVCSDMEAKIKEWENELAESSKTLLIRFFD